MRLPIFAIRLHTPSATPLRARVACAIVAVLTLAVVTGWETADAQKHGGNAVNTAVSMTSNTITTHVLDTALGAPARGVFVVLERIAESGAATPIGSGATDGDGRLRDLLAAGGSLDEGTYRLTFETGQYFAASQRSTFFPTVSIVFRVGAGSQHYHVPLLISPFGYTTYRGS